MAQAEDPTPTPTVQEAAHFALLRQFVVDCYRISPTPTSRIDGAAFVRRFAVFADQRDVPPPPAHLVYTHLRAMGLVVQRHSQNRMTLFGIEEQPHAATPLGELDAAWPDLADRAADRSADRAVSRALQAVQTTLALAPAVIEESADLLLEVMRTSQDEDRRVRIALAFLDRGIAKVRPREVDENPAIEAQAIESRPALADIVAVLKRREAAVETIDTGADTAQMPDGMGVPGNPEGEALPGAPESAN
jgi:hypothetical protein